MTALLEVNSLSVSYGIGWVLRDVYLSVQVGDVLGVVGESGCGKTTLGQAILGLLPDYARLKGQIYFEGSDLVDMPSGERRKLLGDRLTTVPQASMNALDPMYSVGSQLVEGIAAHRDGDTAGARELTLKGLREVGIADPAVRMKSYPHELSGGSRQRVAIAAGLALKPSLLIADEPTSALDVTIQAQILRLLSSLIREQAGSVILITHDLGVVAQLCTRIAVMYAGQVVEEAEVKELFEAPAHPYTKKLLAAHPAVTPRGNRLATIDGQVPDPAHLPPGCSFQPRCPVAIMICGHPPPWVKIGDKRFVRCVHYGSTDPAA